MRTPSFPWVVLLVLGAGCATPQAEPEADTPVAGFQDVHGLAVHPEDSNVLFVATHSGLIRGSEGAWVRVGTMQDDLMGFSMHPTDPETFWTSGHPRGGGNMGVRRSSDGGATWQTLWSESVDFHAMTVSPADPSKLWGTWQGKLLGSTDAGATWSVVAPSPPPMRALVAHPAEAATLLATTQKGIERSADGGATWAPLAGIPALGLAFDPRTPTTVYAGGQDALWKSEDGGQTWRPLQAPARGAYAFLAVARTDPNVVYAATYETGVYKSIDGGAAWVQIKAPSR